MDGSKRKHEGVGPDKRRWRQVVGVPCAQCGCTPVAAKSGAGANVACPISVEHGWVFGSSVQLAIQKWNSGQEAGGTAAA